MYNWYRHLDFQLELIVPDFQWFCECVFSKICFSSDAVHFVGNSGVMFDRDASIDCCNNPISQFSCSTLRFSVLILEVLILFQAPYNFYLCPATSV